MARRDLASRVYEGARDTGSMSDYLSLHGRPVVARDYAKVKAIARLLAGELPPLRRALESRAQTAAVTLAQQVLADWRRIASAYTEADRI